MRIKSGNKVWQCDAPPGLEANIHAGFTNYTEQSIVQLTLHINIFWIDGCV